MSKLEELGGRITYGFDSVSDGDSFVWFDIRRLLFYSFCEPVVEIDLASCDVTDLDLSCLRNLPEVRILRLGGNPGLTSNGLRHIQGMRRIETLVLWRTGIDDTAMRHLQSLTKLRELDLFDTVIGDEGISLLKDSTDLEVLNLCMTSVTDEALESIRALPRLSHLNVAGTRVTDNGITELEGMLSLRKLSLGAFMFAGGEPAWTSCEVSPDSVAEFERRTPWCEVSY